MEHNTHSLEQEGAPEDLHRDYFNAPVTHTEEATPPKSETKPVVSEPLLPLKKPSQIIDALVTLAVIVGSAAIGWWLANRSTPFQ